MIVMKTAYQVKSNGCVSVPFVQTDVSSSLRFGDTAKPTDKMIAPVTCLKRKHCKLHKTRMFEWLEIEFWDHLWKESRGSR